MQIPSVSINDQVRDLTKIETVRPIRVHSIEPLVDSTERAPEIQTDQTSLSFRRDSTPIQQESQARIQDAEVYNQADALNTQLQVTEEVVENLQQELVTSLDEGTEVSLTPDLVETIDKLAQKKKATIKKDVKINLGSEMNEAYDWIKEAVEKKMEQFTDRNLKVTLRSSFVAPPPKEKIEIKPNVVLEAEARAFAKKPKPEMEVTSVWGNGWEPPYKDPVTGGIENQMRMDELLMLAKRDIVGEEMKKQAEWERIHPPPDKPQLVPEISTLPPAEDKKPYYLDTKAYKDFKLEEQQTIIEHSHKQAEAIQAPLSHYHQVARDKALLAQIDSRKEATLNRLVDTLGKPRQLAALHENKEDQGPTIANLFEDTLKELKANREQVMTIKDRYKDSKMASEDKNKAAETRIPSMQEAQGLAKTVAQSIPSQKAIDYQIKLLPQTVSQLLY